MAILLSAALGCAGTKQRVARCPSMDTAPAVVTGPLSVRLDPLPQALEEPSGEDDQLIKSSLALANAVLMSDCFRIAFQQRKLTHTPAVEPEKLLLGLRGNLELRVVLFSGTYFQNHWSRTVGYDDPVDPTTVHTNTYFLRGPDRICVLASNILHEVAHARGFIHASPLESSSVPYSMNEIFDECVAQEVGAKEVTAPTELVIE